MQRSNQRIGLSGQNAKSLDQPPIGSMPVVPETGKPENRFIFQQKPPGLRNSAQALPFKEAICQNQATPVAKRRAKSGLFCRRLRPGIDRPTGVGRCRSPERKQPPFQGIHGWSLPLHRSDQGCHLTGPDIVSWCRNFCGHSKPRGDLMRVPTV